MRTLYLDCGMGAAGDMLSAALIELLPDPDGFVKELNALGIPGVEFKRETAVKCGITGSHMKVTVNGIEEESHDHHHDHDHEHTHEHEHHHDHEHEHTHEHTHDHEHSHEHEHTHDHEHGDGHTHHHHSGMHDIEHIVRGHLPVSDKVKDDVMAVYGLIAQAESKAHGAPVSEIHFHEVGTMDAVADITAVCMIMERLAPEQVIVSPIHVGSGHVHCAHGVLPVPAPATAHILQNVPIYSGDIKGELCTPTGAAILKHFAAKFGPMPVMRTEKIGYGMGKKDFETANCVRALIGETSEKQNSVIELSCNIDDMTAEAIGFAEEILFGAGALEVYTISIGMKKSRPGTLLCVMCREEQKDEIVGLIFKHTTTIGIREQISRRYTLTRSVETVSTPMGEIRRKTSEGYGVKRSKYEYDDISKIAKERGMSINEVIENI